MKALILTLTLAFIGFTSCSENDSNKQPSADTKEAYINATSKTTWHYFSLSDNIIVGTGEESEVDNQQWAARTDWDIAVNRYIIRTNSGAASTVKAEGGVYTFSATTSFSSVTAVPSGVSFVADQAVTSEGMGGTTTTTVKSEATVILFKKNEDGSMVMPPVYLQTPVYIFRTADGGNYFKVHFTQYQDENKKTGHVKFYSSLIK